MLKNLSKKLERLRKKTYKTCYQVCGFDKKGLHIYEYAHNKFQAVLMAKCYGIQDAYIKKLRG